MGLGSSAVAFALFVVAEEASRHRSFAAFQDHARAIPRRHDAERDQFRFAGEDGTMNKVVFRLEPEPGTGRVRSIPSVTRNGKDVVMQAEPVIHGPGYQVGQGRLHLESRLGSLDITARPEGAPEIVERLGPRDAR